MAIGDFMGSGFNYGAVGGPGINYGAMPTNVFTPDITRTFAGDPQSYYQAARIAQMGDYAALPQFQRTANLGFTPQYGAYLMSGAPGEFSGYNPVGRDLSADWANAIAASAAIGNPDVMMTDAQRNIQATLTGDDARRNALAMASAGLGGGIGYIANARQRALGNLYDLYSARAAGAGQPAGGFLSWLDTTRQPAV
tara:strand:+ start:1784 stop:2371 length:588 start_codon:yes stop_codon:yes gene_type:complete